MWSFFLCLKKKKVKSCHITAPEQHDLVSCGREQQSDAAALTPSLFILSFPSSDM